MDGEWTALTRRPLPALEKTFVSGFPDGVNQSLMDPRDTSTRHLILASASPRRHELLSAWGIDFEALPATGIDERSVSGAAGEVAQQLAVEKAAWTWNEALQSGTPEDLLWVLGCDTVVTFAGEVLGKPEDEDDARRMLDLLSGNTHQVVSAVAVAHPDGELCGGISISTVTFKALDDATIEAYVQSGDPMGKAGAYAIQSGGGDLVEHLRGCYYNVVGLPYTLTMDLLELEHAPCDCGKFGERYGSPICANQEQ